MHFLAWIYYRDTRPVCVLCHGSLFSQPEDFRRLKYASPERNHVELQRRCMMDGCIA